MTSSPVLNLIFAILGLIGFAGIVSGITVKYVGKKLDKNEAKREERENARLESELLMHEGLCATGHLAEATAIAVKEGKSNGKTDRALEYYRVYRDKEDAFMRRQATERLHEAG